MASAGNIIDFKNLFEIGLVAVPTQKAAPAVHSVAQPSVDAGSMDSQHCPAWKSISEVAS